MFGVQELATAAQYNIGLISLVFNNRAYGNVLRDQDNLFQGRHVASDLKNPDFVKLAESFGVKGLRVSSPAELKPLLAQSVDADQPVLIEVDISGGLESPAWEFINMYTVPGSD